MRKGLRITLLATCGVLLVVAIALFVLYLAARQVPEFYRQAMTADPLAQKQASGRMMENAARLNNSLRTDGRWQSECTAEEINGWLATELPRSEPPVLPPELHDPRVAIDPDGITLAARAEGGGLAGVVSLKLDVYLESPQVLALRIRKARAGAVPWPLGEITRSITQAAEHADLPLRWRQADGDPVALITIPALRIEHRVMAVRLDSVRLEKGRIVLTGTSHRQKP
jgi:hypothetical protein